MRTKRMLSLAVSCGVLIGGLVVATPSATPAAHADDPTPTPTPTSGGGGGGTGGNGVGGGGHTGR